ncbi:hypothetical protein PMIN04_012900 [Paraphaeosphaeria minitans]|uniref:Uncharacterized protein n=1 Tax=Paraphaeosphaeria minitans TaxID=565426 RepID=A0A9P6KK89_9PLEO|nr:hypothetical protein PMIN01_12156 [Paraphaeosphaeria minitans]
MDLNFIAEPNGLETLKTLLSQLHDQLSLLESLHGTERELLGGASHSLKYNRVQELFKFARGPAQADAEHERRRQSLRKLAPDSMAMCAATFTPKAVLGLHSSSFDTLCGGLPEFFKRQGLSTTLEPLQDFIRRTKARIDSELRIVVMDQSEQKRPRKRVRMKRVDNDRDRHTCVRSSATAPQAVPSGQGSDPYHVTLDAVVKPSPAETKLQRAEGGVEAPHQGSTNDAEEDYFNLFTSDGSDHCLPFGMWQEDNFDCFGILQANMNPDPPHDTILETPPGTII